jgi:hypothetical protein
METYAGFRQVTYVASWWDTATVSGVWDHNQAERLALAHFLEGLASEKWDAQSLRAGWGLRDVPAHLGWAPTKPPLEAMTGWARGRLREISPPKHLSNQTSHDELTGPGAETLLARLAYPRR